MSKQKLDEILEAEKVRDDRIQSRKRGFKLMSVRDSGWRRLSNGTTMLWPVNRDPLPGEALPRVPEGNFVLIINGKELLFDAEEFRKYLRWV